MEDFFAQLGQGSVTDAFLATSLLILALIATGFTVSSVLRLRSEELSGRVDPILATATPRSRWMLSHLVVAVGGTTLVMLATGVSVGVGYAVASRDRSMVAPLAGAGLAFVAAMLVFAGVGLMLHGLSPRWSMATWGFYAFALVVGMLGEMLDLPQWMMNLSPFQHVPALPAASFEWLPIVALLVVAALAATIGRIALERRDMAAG
jgi:ABC-2 type transport system permease protein